MVRLPRFGILQIGGLAVAAVLFATPACSLGTEADEKPTSARITVTGSAPSPLQLVVSTDFFEQLIGEGVEIRAVLITADTIPVTPPFEQVTALDELGSVFYRLIQPDTVPSTVTMRVLLDGTLEYDQEATLSAGASLEYRFVFVSLF
jgi:hypothetical protein